MYDYYGNFSDDPTELISDRDLFEKMQPNDGMVSFVGMLSTVQYHPATDNNKERLNVVLTNKVPNRKTDQEWKVQLTVWDKDVKRWRPFFDTSNILHVVGAAVRTRYGNSEGNVKYDLAVRDYTKIQIVGKIKAERSVESENNHQPIELNDIVKYDEKPVSLTAFLKMEFLFDSRRDYCEGVVASKTSKFTVRCCDASLAGKHKVGEMLKIKGFVKCGGSPSFLEVQNPKDIEVMPGRTATVEELRQAINVPRKRTLELMTSN